MCLGFCSICILAYNYIVIAYHCLHNKALPDTSSSHVLFVLSVEGGDQHCCYGVNGDLLTDANAAGAVSRFSATRQPYHYMLHDYWPKLMCGQLANATSVYRQLRRSDDCRGYVPPKCGTTDDHCKEMVILYTFTFCYVIY